MNAGDDFTGELAVGAEAGGIAVGCALGSEGEPSVDALGHGIGAGSRGSWARYRGDTAGDCPGVTGCRIRMSLGGSSSSSGALGADS